MATLKLREKEAVGADFLVIEWTSATPEKEVRAAFRAIRKWVVVPRANTAPAACYSAVLSNLQGTFAAPEQATTDSVRQVIAKGFQRDSFDRLKTALNVSGVELSQVIRIPYRTVTRREAFKPDESERILRVALAFHRAIEVTGSIDLARRWFSGPKRALGDKTPLEYCDTELGAHEVVQLLGRIDHGVFT